ncbi:hypothetical protein BDQ17DRAFT_1325665 [Cyathus striatus]|nr:hypothetical protein BDQ17DRAFT_1325665 [Cyathus striatus]
MVHLDPSCTEWRKNGEGDMMQVRIPARSQLESQLREVLTSTVLSGLGTRDKEPSKAKIRRYQSKPPRQLLILELGTVHSTIACSIRPRPRAAMSAWSPLDIGKDFAVPRHNTALPPPPPIPVPGKLGETKKAN